MRFQPKHGLRNHPAYGAWRGMVQRCTDRGCKDYPKYGGAGVTVCERWRDFAAFLADMGERPPGMTIDRIDNSKGYEPGNCRWATRATQTRNRRVTKITRDLATTIAAEYARGGVSQTALARKHGVSQAQVSLVALGKHWTQLETK